eukprot:m.671515 g.671515  ORF g.671515 m.671515 type:complete len:155 (-) comp22773_c0_seq1:650-1114(-)
MCHLNQIAYASFSPACAWVQSATCKHEQQWMLSLCKHADEVLLCTQNTPCVHKIIIAAMRKSDCSEMVGDVRHQPDAGGADTESFRIECFDITSNISPVMKVLKDTMVFVLASTVTHLECVPGRHTSTFPAAGSATDSICSSPRICVSSPRITS